MAYKILNKRGDWLVQVQKGRIRRSRRGTGGEVVAKQAETSLVADIAAELRIKAATALLGLPEKAVAAVP